MAIWVATWQILFGCVVGMAGTYLFERLGDQVVHQIVGFDAESLAAGDFDVRALAVLLGERNAEVGAAARGKRHHFVVEVDGLLCLLVVAEGAQSGDDDVL